MNQKISLQLSTYPKAMREFAQENLNLKFLCGALISILFILLILVLYLVKKGPLIIALDGQGEIAKVESKVTDLQIQSAIKEYIGYRYSWNEKNVSESLGRAKNFIQPTLHSAFDKSMIEVQKFVREKKITQRVYPKEIKIDLKDRKITVQSDRITQFDSLKAATEMKLVFQFVIENRTVINPWGVYVTKEMEEALQ